MTKRIRKVNAKKAHDSKYTNGYNPTGWKGMYDRDTMVPQIEMLSKLGATSKQMAEFFGVELNTFENWIRQKPEVAEAKRAGGIHADMKVAASLYQRAIGFRYKEEEISEEAQKDAHGNITPFKLIKRRVTNRMVIGDVKAQTHWLRNRQREHWTEAPYKVENFIKGRIDHHHLTVDQVDLETLTQEAQDALFELGVKQLNVDNRNN